VPDLPQSILAAFPEPIGFGHLVCSPSKLTFPRAHTCESIMNQQFALAAKIWLTMEDNFLKLGAAKRI
jgi:hypothetical protein